MKQHDTKGTSITVKPRSLTAKDRNAPMYEQDAMSVRTFSCRNGIGYVKAYDEIKTGRLRTMKVGTRRLITQQAASDWRSLCEAEVV